MINQIIASPRRSLQGAINRAKQLPQAGGNEFDPLASTWEDDGVWLGDWGKIRNSKFEIRRICHKILRNYETWDKLHITRSFIMYLKVLYNDCAREIPRTFEQLCFLQTPSKKS